MEGEPVVGRDEVDGRGRAAAVGFVEVARPGQAGGELGDAVVLTAPEVPHGITVLAVPLGPQRREVADLVATGAQVPGFGDQFDLGDDRILLDEVEERGQSVDLVELPCQGRGQIEPESVDVHIGDPVAQRVHDELEDMRMTDPHAVAGAGVVHVVARIVLYQPIVGGIVDSAEAEHGTHVVPLGRVIVHHVQDHLDAGIVQVLHHQLELLDLLPRPGGGRVGVVGGQEGQ